MRKEKLVLEILAGIALFSLIAFCPKIGAILVLCMLFFPK